MYTLIGLCFAFVAFFLALEVLTLLSEDTTLLNIFLSFCFACIVGVFWVVVAVLALVVGLLGCFIFRKMVG